MTSWYFFNVKSAVFDRHLLYSLDGRACFFWQEPGDDNLQISRLR